VTGATGFIGRRLVARLMRDGWAVRALVRPGRDFGHPGVRIVHGDLASQDSLAELTDGADVVFHVAGSTSPRSDTDFRETNVLVTRLLTEVAGSSIGRLVFVSSLAVTGPSRPGEPHPDATCSRPVTIYGRSKSEAEATIRLSAATWSVARPCAVYGPGDRSFARLFRAIRKLGFAPVFAGNQELSLVHVDDLVDALILLALRDEALSRVFHIAHPDISTQRNLALAVGRAVGRAPVILQIPRFLVRPLLAMSRQIDHFAGTPSPLAAWKWPELMATAWTCSTAPAEAALGFAPRFGLDQGLSDAAAWDFKEGWL